MNHSGEALSANRSRRFVFDSPGKLRGASGYAGGASFIEMEIYQQVAYGMAGSNSRYTAATRPAIYFASSAYF
jgi:hypothetical protein